MVVFIHIDKNNKHKYISKNKKDKSYLERNLKNKNVFILIYMEGCGPCNEVRPEWSKLKNVLNKNNNNENFVILDIDKDIVENINYLPKPNSFPTIKYINNKENIMENYEDSNILNKDRSIDSLVEWINSKTTKDIKKIYPQKKTVKKNISLYGGKTKSLRRRKWTLKYKQSINCKRPKGFSQKQYCKYGVKK